MTEIRTSTAIVMLLHPLGKGGIVGTGISSAFRAIEQGRLTGRLSP